MPARKRKVTYPPARTATRQTRPGAGDAPVVRQTVVAIDVSAAGGRSGLKVGDRVRIDGSGMYAGEIAIIERFVNAVIPSAVVRTEAGRSRQARTIDLTPVSAIAQAAAED